MQQQAATLQIHMWAREIRKKLRHAEMAAAVMDEAKHWPDWRHHSVRNRKYEYRLKLGRPPS